MEASPVHKLDDLNGENMEDIHEPEDDEETIKQKWTPLLVQSCQKGDVDNARLSIERRANVLIEDKKKWTPLMWASCKGYVEIVKLLLRNGAAMPYLQKKRGSNPNNQEEVDRALTNMMMESQLGNPKDPAAQQQVGVKIGQVNYEARYSPLMWACFKGYLNIVWLFLKEGMDLYETDVLGNNCIHQSAAGGFNNVFECLLEFGVSITAKNARDHGVEELATTREIKNLITLHNSTKNCPLCSKSISKEKDLKYFCDICKQFYCGDCRLFFWLYESHDATEQERPESRCKKCHEDVLVVEEELKNHMNNYDLKRLAELLEKIRTQKIHIEVKLFHAACRMKDKLTVQENLKNLIHTLQHVTNYKTIKKSINILQDIVKDARKDEILLDQDILDTLDKEIARLTAERDLRYELDNLQINEAKPEEVKLLEDLISVAKERKVEEGYVGEADILKEKMDKNIETKKYFKLFTEYPLREYPEILPIDPKTKRPIDPNTKKPMDAKTFAEYTKQQEIARKKKRKEPKFIIPEWTLASIEPLEKSIKAIEALLVQKDLEFDDNFQKEVAPHIVRMKKEVRFRKNAEEEAKALADKKKGSKKK